MSNIYEYISNYACNCDITLVNEINNVFNNSNNNNYCSIKNSISNPIKINGITNIINDIGIDNIIYILPNLFRKCFYSKQIKLPEACPSYMSSSSFIKYSPLLINKNIIKSFLYFNFPGDYKNFNINNQINQIVKLKNILIKKKNVTYGSFTSSAGIINEIYSNNSILFELVNFNNYLLKCDFYGDDSKIGNVYNIKWNILISCLSYNENNVYTIGSCNSNNNNLIKKSLIINNEQGVLLNKIRNSNSLGSTFAELKNLFNLLDYANEVYEDISLSIKYFMINGVFCKKNYMSLKNLSPLLKIYNIYYDNQLYINEKSLNLNNVNNLIPTTITLTEYINKFISIFKTTYPNTTYLKNVILFITNGFVFFNDNLIENDYYYYYIDTLNPSPTNLTNIWVLTIDYSTSGIDIFINNFLYGVDSYAGFISISGATTYKYTSHSGGGLYPDKGLNYTSTYNIGYKYLFYNNSKKLLYTVYLTLRTINTSEAYGVSLII